MGHEKDEVRKMSRLAIITARGGSKRIPKKNIRDFCGKPILAYSIEAALSSRLFDHVMVSTDDTEIAEIAKKYGAEVPFFRSEATSGDFATTNDVLAEVLAEYEKRDMHFDVACCIYPHSAFCDSGKTESSGRTAGSKRCGHPDSGGQLFLPAPAGHGSGAGTVGI